MSEPTLVSSTFWNWGNGVLFDAKFITSAVVGALGTALTVQRNLGEITGHSTPARKLENNKIAELLDMLAKVPPGDSFSACRKELELQIAESLRELDALRTKESKLTAGPNHGLTLMQRLFVLFPPHSPSTWVIHALAYAFIAGGPLVILMLVLFGIGGTGSIGDVTVMVVFGGLAFRAWALAERKWAIESLKRAGEWDQRIQAEFGPLHNPFVLRKSRGWRMLVAQISMWTCLFCAVESFEDIMLSALDAGKGAKSGLLLFVTSLLGAGICRGWAAAEGRHGSPSSHPGFSKAIFPVPKRATWKAGLLIASYLAAMAALIVSVVKWSLIFKDPLDLVEFAFVLLAVCIACNRLLSFLGHAADNSNENKSAALAQSAAA